MANIPIYPGSSSFLPGLTPFGFYDFDFQFQEDADKLVTYCARRLGYPLTDIELQDLNFYAAFEDAITTYGNEVFSFQIRDNLLSLEGAPTDTYVNNALITPNFATIIRISQQYAAEAGAGGNITYYSGALALTPGKQTYNLKEWAISQSISGGIEIKTVFYQNLPAINQMYAPFGGFAGLGGLPAAGIYGGMYGGGYGGGYLMMPVAYDAGVIQGLELSNTIRLSNYTFNIVNNILSVFPVPGTGFAGSDFDGGEDLWYGQYLVFDFIKVQDRIDASFANGTNKITNVGNAPYVNPIYTNISSIGRSWIFEYTLAICKEMLGYIRGKYTSIPIPGAEVTLNQGDLITAATAEKEALITRLREYFDTTSKQSLLERRAAESTARQTELNQVPMTIYIA